jgi:hypothetical protein
VLRSSGVDVGEQVKWRERVRIELTRAAGGVSVAVLKTGQTTRPDPLPGYVECMEYSKAPPRHAAPHLSGEGYERFMKPSSREA